MSRKANQAAAPLPDSRGIRGCMKQRILEDMIGSVPGAFKVLIVDKVSAEVLSTCLRMSELMDHGVTLVEDIGNVRQPLPKSPAIYFVAPTESSLKQIIDDFSTKDKYQDANIFFTSRAPQKLIDGIAASRLVTKVKALKEMMLDFCVPDTLSFHFGMTDEMVQLIGPLQNPAAVTTAVTRLLSVIHTLGDNPIIRYQNTAACRGFAEQIAAQADQLAKDVPALAKQDGRSILVIVDRTLDPAAALLHDRTYEGALDDLFPLKNMIYEQKYEDRTGKTATRSVVLDEQDALWCQHRHLFIVEAVKRVQARIDQLLKDNPALSGQQQLGKGAKLKDIGNAIRALPEFQEKLGKLSLHQDVLVNIMDRYNKVQCALLAEIEQKALCGGASTKEILEVVRANLKTADAQVKLRLYLTLCLANLKDFDTKKKQQLKSDLGLDENVDTLHNIDAFTNRVGVQKMPKRSSNLSESPDTYVSQVKLVLEALAADTLSTTDFPFARPTDANSTPAAAAAKKTSLRSGRQSSAAGTRPGERCLDLGHDTKIALASPQRLIVFVLGGVLRCEVRAAYEVAQELKREAVVGGTSLLNAEKFLRQLPGLQ